MRKRRGGGEGWEMGKRVMGNDTGGDEKKKY